MAFSCSGNCGFGEGANGFARANCDGGGGIPVEFPQSGLGSCSACIAQAQSFCDRVNGKPNLTSRISRMRSATGGRFRGQSGVSTTGFYEAGVQAAQAAFQAGGVNALLSFLAGFNSGQ